MISLISVLLLLRHTRKG